LFDSRSVGSFRQPDHPRRSRKGRPPSSSRGHCPIHCGFHGQYDHVDLRYWANQSRRAFSLCALFVVRTVLWFFRESRESNLLDRDNCYSHCHDCFSLLFQTLYPTGGTQTDDVWMNWMP
jgi:hypothetical protein